jgi:phage-related protein
VSNAIDLAAKVTLDTSDAVAGFDKVADSAKGMGDAVDRASKQADTAVDRFGSTAEAADNMASKTGQATGALGALSSGFELVGLDKYAAGLQSAAMATDFMSGASDALNLVTESQIVLTAKAKVQALALAVQERATAVATRVWAATQWALNAALNANPIGLLILAVVAAVAAIILLYKKSDTFRLLVGKLSSAVTSFATAAASAFSTVLTKVQAVFTWLNNNWSKLENILKAPFNAAADLFKSLFGTDGAIVAIVQGVIDDILAIVGKVIDAINVAIRAINKIPGVNVGTIPKPSSASQSASRSTTTTPAGLGRAATPALTTAGAVVVNINLTRGFDDYQTGARIARTLTRYGLITGRITT